MSCQQVPRLTEDPYVFTETVPTTPVLFSPQKSRQQQQQSKPTTQTSFIQTSTHDTASNCNLNQHLFGGRFNGTTTAIDTPSASIAQQQQVINGMHKNVISITTNSNGSSCSTSSSSSSQPIPIKSSQQSQPPHSKIVTTASVTVTPAAATSCCDALSQQVTSLTQAQNSTAKPAQHLNPKQQLQQVEQQQRQHQQTLFTAALSNDDSSPQSLTSSSTLLPPSNFHQNTLAQHIQKVGSSLKNSNNSTMPALCSRSPLHSFQQQQQYSRAAVYTHKPPSKISHNVTSSQTISSTLDSSVKQNHSDLNEIPASVIYRSPIKDQSVFGTTLPAERFNETNASSSAHLKSVDLNDKKVVFATPAKRDSRVLSSSAKKSLKSLITGGAPGKVKRPLTGQMGHHETLQGVSSSSHLMSTSLSSSYPPSLSLTSPSVRRRWKVRRNSDDWHAPDTYVFDSVSPLTSLNERRQRSLEKCDSTIAASRVSCIQQHWLGVYDMKDSMDISPRTLNIGREERIERHKALLRRQAVQMLSSQDFLKATSARNTLVFVSKCLKKFKSREDGFPTKRCCIPSCTNNALALTAQCYMHITRNLHQHLFLPCTAKFADNTQCRIPVFDIAHELPLCREHGWKRDNYNRIVQEQRPKAKIPRKPSKSLVVCGRPPKRNKKKRKGSTSSLESIGSSNTITMSSASTTPVISSLTPVSQAALDNVTKPMAIDGNMSVTMPENGYDLKTNEIMQANMLSDVQHMIRNQTQQNLFPQDMLSICDNSSVYASSEDTGVGGLSESELMVGTQDAEEIPLGDDITNVLNNLPVDTFNELFTAVHQDEQEEVERALELADKQIKSLQQMTASDADFLRGFLDDNDQILEDTDITGILPSPSPDTSGIDTNTLFVDGGSNSTAGSCTGPTPTDIRGLVQT